MNLAEIKIHQCARVKAIGGDKALRSHLLDMGVVPGVVVRLENKAPLGDPLEIHVRGYNLSLRKHEAILIDVEPLDEADHPHNDHDAEFGYKLSMSSANSHPGLGEEGRYHNHEDEQNALPKGTQLHLAIVGQKNCGKTSLYNAITGSNEHVGNFPGQTTERVDGQVANHPEAIVTDLPGLYSLSPHSADESITLDYILKNRPHCIINVIDANNVERGLYLTVQLMDLHIPMVLALNMMDQVRGNGGSIRLNELESELGIPVVPVSASRGEGVDELISHALHIARYQETPALCDLCDKYDNGGSVHRCIHGIKHLVENHAQRTGIPAHFAATKLAEGDDNIAEMLALSESERVMIDGIVFQMEQERGMDRAAAIADMRFTYIDKVCRRTIIRPEVTKEYLRTRKIDRVLTGKWTAIPIFIAVMGLTIWTSIDLLGAPLQELLEGYIVRLGEWTDAKLASYDVNDAVRSLVAQGIFGGVGSVVSFVPIIILLFFFLSLLEDSGYMSRIAFVTDRILRHLGLSGRSIIPLLVGFGCSVPAVMASRTLPSASDRRKTMMLIPFMSCSAKIPLYAFLSAAFFPGHGGLVFVGLYLMGIIAAIIVAFVNKYFGSRTEAAPFIMELPNYRLPSVKSVAQLLWDKTRDFLTNAFTIIFLASIAIWFLQTFSFRLDVVDGGEGSMLAWISGLLAPLFGPLGLGDWRVVTALISGLMAKEGVVASMKMLGVTALLTPASALSMLVFCLLYTPCVATIATVKRELGWKHAFFMVAFQCAVAWVAAFVAYQFAIVLL